MNIGCSVEQLASRWGSSFPAGAEERLEHYLDLVEEWDRAHRLTGHRDRQTRWQGLVVESLTLSVPLIGRAGRIVDMGCGNGAPGVIMAIVAPRWEVFGIESRVHRFAFLKHVARELDLSNFDVRRGRVERPAESELGGFDLGCARAFAELGTSLALASPYLKEGGGFIALGEGEVAPGWNESWRSRFEVGAGRFLVVRVLSQVAR